MWQSRWILKPYGKIHGMNGCVLASWRLGEEQWLAISCSSDGHNCVIRVTYIKVIGSLRKLPATARPLPCTEDTLVQYLYFSFRERVSLHWGIRHRTGILKHGNVYSSMQPRLGWFQISRRLSTTRRYLSSTVFARKRQRVLCTLDCTAIWTLQCTAMLNHIEARSTILSSRLSIQSDMQKSRTGSNA